MAPGRSDRVAAAVDAWRRELGDGNRMRADDVEELCEHFREALEERLAGGSSWANAQDFARATLGDPDALVDELARVRRPPRWYQRWSAALAAYAVVHSGWIIGRVAILSLLAYEARLAPVELETGVLEASLVSVAAGLALVVWIASRFQVFRAGAGLARGSWLPMIGAVVALGPVLLFGVLFADYWSWWLAPGQRPSATPWETGITLLLFAIAAPVVALIGAGLVSQRTPAAAVS